MIRGWIVTSPVHKMVGLFALSMVAALMISAADAADRFEFEGTVEPSQRIIIAPKVNGTLQEALVRGGEHVTPGQVLFRLDPASYELDVKAAEAALAEAEAALRLATATADRLAELQEKGAGAAAKAIDAAIEVDAAKARRDAAQAALEQAGLALSRTELHAPIAGVASRPSLSTGAFIEAETGAVIGEVVAIDPVLVGYHVPHETRLEALNRSGEETVEALFARLRLTLVLPDGRQYPHPGQALFESVSIDPETGALITWAEFPNPDRILAPGLEVRVISEIVTETSQ